LTERNPDRNPSSKSKPSPNEPSPRKLDWVRSEIERMRGQMRAQERELRMLQRAGIPTASAELLLSRMRAKVDDLCRERGALRAHPAAHRTRS
jgi:hypothetical protein